ncbi:MAG: YHS domain-containing (seleno)protein [Proteobacteria bacterium]|nr:YHS domain-containing (seleno)protein [Pseudomonadota bacterium]
MKNLTSILLVISLIVVSILGGYYYYLINQLYQATGVIFNTDKNIAINGYDTVAYFIEKKPTLGAPEFQTVWEGSNWYFSNSQNRDSFIKNPEQYMPQFGGYDPYSVTQGYSNPSNPEYYTIYAGMLYLHYSDTAKQYWNDKRAENMLQATSNWNYLRLDLEKLQTQSD